MSEVVVRMEMPQHCGECNLYVNGWCYAITPDSPQEKEWYSSHKERPPICPIICQLPEGHGRLGDLDELERKMNGARIRVMQDGQDTNPYWECGDIIASEKTIVPAERREE